MDVPGPALGEEEGVGGSVAAFLGHFRQNGHRCCRGARTDPMPGPEWNCWADPKGVTGQGWAGWGSSGGSTDTPPGAGLPLGAEDPPGGEGESSCSTRSGCFRGAGRGGVVFPPGIPRTRCRSQQEGPPGAAPLHLPQPPVCAQALLGAHSRLLWLKGYCQCPPVDGF